VVTSAQPIITIVPDGTPLIVEAIALNQDIGFIQVGQKAELKLDTFPFQKYGTIEGEFIDSGDGRVFSLDRDELDAVDSEQTG